MNNPELQLMLHGDGIGSLQPVISYQGVELRQVTKLENPNYLVIDLTIAPETKPGSFSVRLTNGKKDVATYNYELKERAASSATRESFGPEDVLYLITPDRFANGDPSNDSVSGMREQANRSEPGGRHGGDIKGMQNRLDYIADMGFTAVWINPVLENNMNRYSYHGYSTTDFYKTDPRFGTNEDYKAFIDAAHGKGIKIIMDMIVNHSGSEHWWMKDLPTSDWLNYQDEYLKGGYQETSHRKPVIQDPYKSKIDLKEFTDGWFVRSMPDLNQRNPYMSKYLIQNTIWWVEFSGIDGIRMDTYPYPDMDFMTEWTCALQNEYPNFNTVGEEWFEDPAILAHWQQGKVNPNGYTSCLPSLMDFPLQSAVTKALTTKEDYWNGWLSLYTALAKDFLYADPDKMVVFPDNHDMSRFFSQVNENYDLFKLGIAYILTVRGTPQIYYGTEILMKNPGTSDHGIIRSDFPGGWSGDAVNAFTGEGLTDLQKDAQAFHRNLLNWRKNQSTVHTGEVMHYTPKDGIYVLFRYDEKDKVMVILSKNTESKTLDLSRFAEMNIQGKSGKDIISGRQIELNGTLEVPAMSPMIIDFN